MKKCNKCEQCKPTTEFWRNNAAADGLQSICKNCKRAVVAEVEEAKRNGVYISKCRQPRLTDQERQERAEQKKEYWKQYRQDNKSHIYETKKEYRLRLRQEGIKAYGGVCSCCGEEEIGFLTLEHLEGRTDGDRSTSWHAWMKLRKRGWPKDKYTVLCFNCNQGKSIYGICPHQRGKYEVEGKTTEDD